MKYKKLPKNMIDTPAGVKRRTGTKFIKEVEKPYEMVTLKAFDGCILEIGETYVKILNGQT